MEGCAYSSPIALFRLGGVVMPCGRSSAFSLNEFGNHRAKGSITEADACRRQALAERREGIRPIIAFAPTCALICIQYGLGYGAAIRAAANLAYRHQSRLTV